MGSSISALELKDEANCATQLFQELWKIAKDDTAEAFRKHWEMGALTLNPNVIRWREFMTKVLRLNDEVREADGGIAWSKATMAKLLISKLPTKSMEWVAEKNAVERDIKVL